MRKRFVLLAVGVLAVVLMVGASSAEAHGPHYYHAHYWNHVHPVPVYRAPLVVVPAPRPAPVVYYYPPVVVPAPRPVVQVVTPVVPAPVVVQPVVVP
jgi:hypothetical protein